MNILEFFSDVFAPNIWLYVLSILILVLPALYLYNKFGSSIIDPLVYQLLMAVFANAIPIFLYLTGNCSKELFFYFLASESLFWFGIIRFSGKTTRFQEKTIKNELHIEVSLFAGFFFLYAFLEVFTYLKFGIPALMTNRNQVYAGSGGWGLISYIKPFLSLYFLIYLMDKFYKKQFKRKYLYCSIFYLITCLLDGGRGAIMNFFFAYFFYRAFYVGKMPKIKLKYLLVVPLFALVSISFQMVTEGESALLMLGERIVAFGDVYYFAYPNDVINTIKLPDPILHLLSPILRPFRIVSYTLDEALPLGSKVLYAMNSEYELAEVMSAPNTRIPIASWIYFKWYGLVLSFLVGYSISLIIFRFRKYFHHTVLGVACYSYIYLQAVAGCTDLNLFLGSLFSVFINFFILLVFIGILTGGTIVIRKIRYGEKANLDYNCSL